MLYKEKLIKCDDGRLYLSTQLDLNEADPFIRIVCEKNQFRMERASSAALLGCDIVIEPRISCQRILIPQAIVDAYGFTKSTTINMEKKANGDCCYKVAMFRSPKLKSVTKPSPFTEYLDDTKMHKEKAVKIPGLGSERLMINGMRGLLRVDVYSEKRRMIVVRKYDAIRDANDVPDYQYLAEQYGNGLYNMPRGDFSFSINVIGNQGLPVYRAITRMLETNKDTVYRVYTTASGSVVLVPEDISCDVCGATINLKESAPTTVYMDEEVAKNPSLLLPIFQNIERLEDLTDQMKLKIEELARLLAAEKAKNASLRSILMHTAPSTGNGNPGVSHSASHTPNPNKVKRTHSPKLSSANARNTTFGTKMPAHNVKFVQVDVSKVNDLLDLANLFDKIEEDYSFDLDI